MSSDLLRPPCIYPFETLEGNNTSNTKIKLTIKDSYSIGHVKSRGLLDWVMIGVVSYARCKDLRNTTRTAYRSYWTGWWARPQFICVVYIPGPQEY